MNTASHGPDTKTQGERICRNETHSDLRPATGLSLEIASGPSVCAAGASDAFGTLHPAAGSSSVTGRGFPTTTSFAEKKTPTRERSGIFPDVYLRRVGEAIEEKGRCGT